MMTISRYTYTFLFFLLFFIGTLNLQGQFKDFQTWWELELNKELSGKLDLSGELEQRFRNNSTQYASTLVSLSASYDLLKYLSIKGGARTTFRMNMEQGMQARFRLHMDVMGKYDLSGFDLSLRARFQYGFDEMLALRYFRVNSMVNRYRLKVSDHIFGTKLDWFASVESWHGANNDSQWHTYGMRYSAGVRYALNLRSDISIRYILEDEYNVPSPIQLHVLVMGYSFDL